MFNQLFSLQLMGLLGVKQFPTVNIINMFRGKRYNNQERPNIPHSKVLAMCVAILGTQTNNIRSINEILLMPVNRDYIRAENRSAYNFNSHQLEKLFATS